jgi:hypothetical protein
VHAGSGRATRCIAVGQPGEQDHNCCVIARQHDFSYTAVCNFDARCGASPRRGAMQSFSFQLVIDCPLETVFAIYTDTDRWRYRNLFGDIRWVQGEPWAEGSRLRLETHTPIRSSIDQVLIKFVPHEKVVYLSHVFGITCETSVTFIPSGGQTVINVSMQLLGTLSRALGFAIEPAIEKATRGFFAELKRECEAASRKATGT